MPSTPNLSLPYPGLTDAPNAPSQVQALALALDVKVAGMNMGTPKTTGTLGPYTVSVGEYFDTTLLTYVFTALPGRRYEARLNGMLVAATVAGDQFVVRIRNGGAVMPLNTSPQVAITQADVSSVAGNEAPGAQLAGTFVPGAGLVTLAVSMQRSVGTGAAACAGTRELYAVDLGPA